MNNNYQNIDFQFSESEMQERLPDYIFGNLEHTQKVIFEKSLPAFPEIQKEIDEVKSVFAKLDKIDYDKVLFDKTKDLPTRVARKMQPQVATKSKYSAWKPLRLIVPVMVFAVVYFIGVQNNFWVDRFISNKIHKPNTLSETMQKINSLDLSNIPDSTIEQLADKSTIYQAIIIEAEDTQDLVASVDELYNDYFFDESFKLTASELINIDINALNINNFNNLQEEEFLEIIEEIQNVNFKS
jgi:hypothetical protein